MADVQIDEGEFTRVANVLLEKAAAAKLNGCQSAIVMVIWRYTYGFQRKEHDLSPSYISAATGYDKRQIQREIAKLVTRNIIKQRGRNGITRTLSFNKNFDMWDKPTYGKLADGEEADGELADGENAVGTYGEKADGTYGELADQERKKETLKEIPYKDIVEYLNFAAGTEYKYSTKTTQKHIAGRWNEGHRIDAFKIVIDKKCAEWKNNPKMSQYLRPQTLFNAEKFESYLNQPIVLNGGGGNGKQSAFQKLQQMGWEENQSEASGNY